MATKARIFLGAADVVILLAGVLALSLVASTASAAGDLLWTSQSGSGFSEALRSVAIDTSGVYGAGYTNGTLPGQMSAGNYDAFLRKYDAGGSGNLQWTLQFGTSEHDFVLGVAVDASGVYVAGYTSGSLPGQTNAGLADAFLRKYDANGNILWTRQFGTSSADIAYAVASGPSGVYVVGETEGALPGQTSAGSLDAYVQKYDALGNLQWTRQFGTSIQDVASNVALDASGVSIIGFTYGTLPGQMSGGSYDVFLQRYDADGNLLWTRQFGVAGQDYAWAVALDASGVYVGGNTERTLPGQMSAGGIDAFLRKYDLNGNVLWTRQFGTSAYDYANTIALNLSGVFVTGSTNGTLPGQTSAGRYDAFVRKYDALGNLLWTRQFGSAGDESGLGGAVGASGIYASGYTDGTLPGQTSAGDGDMYLARFGEEPGMPEDLQASSGDGRVTLAWHPPAWTGGLPITIYRVYRGTAAGSLSFLVDAGTSTTYFDATVTNGITYYYGITAVNALGEGAVSAEASATPNPPSDTTSPAITITSPASGAVLLTTSVTVSGTASDDVGVTKVELSRDGASWVLASGTTAWSGQLILEEGTNTIYARATDAASNAQTVTVQVTVQSSAGAPGEIPIWVWPLIVVVAVAIPLALFAARRRRRPPT